MSVQFPVGELWDPLSSSGWVQEQGVPGTGAAGQAQEEAGHGGGGDYWRGEMAHCGAKVSF